MNAAKHEARQVFPEGRWNKKCCPEIAKMAPLAAKHKLKSVNYHYYIEKIRIKEKECK
jgi:hypothetical protein